MCNKTIYSGEMELTPENRFDLIIHLRSVEATTPDDDLAVWNAFSEDSTPWYFSDRANNVITTDRYGTGAAGNPHCSLDRSTIDVNAAISMVSKFHDFTDIVRSAISSIGRAHALHVRLWKPELDGNYAEALARNVIICGLEYPIQQETKTIDFAARGMHLGEHPILNSIAPDDFDRLVARCENASAAGEALRAFCEAGKALTRKGADERADLP